jgi:hypothetical protein
MKLQWMHFLLHRFSPQIPRTLQLKRLVQRFLINFEGFMGLHLKRFRITSLEIEVGCLPSVFAISAKGVCSLIIFSSLVRSDDVSLACMVLLLFTPSVRNDASN